MQVMTAQEISFVAGGDGTMAILPGDYGFISAYKSFDGVVNSGTLPDYGQVQSTNASLAQFLANNSGSSPSDFYKY